MNDKISKSKLSTFVKKVRSPRSKPCQPTNNNFSISEWQDAYWSLNSRNERDYKVFQSGIWFYEHIKEITAKFYSTPDYQDTKDNLIRFQVGYVNYRANKELLSFYEVNQKNLEASDTFEISNSLESIIDSLKHIGSIA